MFDIYFDLLPTLLNVGFCLTFPNRSIISFITKYKVYLVTGRRSRF